jgi:hypothetical protein
MGAIVYPEGDRWAWCAGPQAYGGGYTTREEAIEAARLLGDEKVEVIDEHPTRPPATLATRRLPAAGSRPRRPRA